MPGRFNSLRNPIRSPLLWSLLSGLGSWLKALGSWLKALYAEVRERVTIPGQTIETILRDLLPGCSKTAVIYKTKAREPSSLRMKIPKRERLPKGGKDIWTCKALQRQVANAFTTVCNQTHVILTQCPF